MTGMLQLQNISVHSCPLVEEIRVELSHDVIFTRAKRIETAKLPEAIQILSNP